VPTNKQRRLAAQRKLARQLEHRREEARRRRNRNLAAGGVFAAVVVVVLVVLFATNVFSGSSKKAAATPTPSSTATSASSTPTATASPFKTVAFPKLTRAAKSTSGPCHYAEAKDLLASGSAKDIGLPPDPKPTPSKGTVKVSLTSSHGPMTFTLDRADAPCAVQSFVYDVQKGLFANTSCPRLVTSGIFVLQCGDPSNSQSGGPTYQYKEENMAKPNYGVGVIAMAHTDQPKTTGSQFFIMYKDSTPGLGKGYSIIGKVSAGMNVVQSVAKGGTNNKNAAGDGAPLLGLTLKTAKLAAV